MKDHNPNWSEKAFVIRNIKNTVPWTYVISDFNGEEIVGMFYENEGQENKNNLELKNNKKKRRQTIC